LKVGDFSGTVVDYAGRSARFSRDGDAFVVEYLENNLPFRRFRVTRTMGWRYEQDYIAVQTHGPEPAGDPVYTEESRIRFAYSVDRSRWFPQSYLEPTEYPGSEYLEDGSLRYAPYKPDRNAFNERCARCHNTYPYDLRFYKMHTEFGMLSGFPPGPGAGPAEARSLAASVGDLSVFEAKQKIPKERFVSVGISCESCHFGGREHASTEGKVPIRFVPTHPDLADWTPSHVGAQKDPAVVNAICRQCHHSGVSAADNWPDGSAGVNSMESVEMDAGGCVSEIRCTHCHNTHVSGPNAGTPDRAEHISACLTCHENYGSESAAALHSRHEVGTATCLDCHMPRIVQGFGVYNRTHRIASPTDPAILGTGMPNACNLCHLDKSLAWTGDALEQGWGKRVDLSPRLQGLYAQGLQRPVGEAWLSHPFVLTRLVAAGAYAGSPLGLEVLPRLLRALDEPNAYLRIGFLQNVEKILGRPLSDAEFAITGHDSVRQKQAQRLIERFIRD
jgi:hypothetical protein